MKRAISVLAASLFVLPLLSQAAPGGNGNGNGNGKKVPDQFIVVLKDNVDVDTAAEELTKKNGGELHHVYKHAMKGFAVKLNENKRKDLESDLRVESVSEDFEVSIDAKAVPVTPQAQYLPSGINRINAENKVNKGTGIEVAVIDTGIDLNHPDLKANILGGKNCMRGGSYADGNGHGTHVAGTIAALSNSIGVVGVAPEAKLWSVRVLDNAGNGTWSSVICGIDFVTSQASHIKVANMSLGGGGTAGTSCGSSPLRQAICNSVNAGVTYVVAAGNAAADLKNMVPAAYPEVIVVSALADSNGASCGGGAATGYGADDTFVSFSNFATLAADTSRLIGAPGVDIYSTWKGSGYNTISGTSMATPHVAGAAALYIKAYPGVSPAHVRAGLLALGEAAVTNMNGECASGFSHSASALHPEPVLRADIL